MAADLAIGAGPLLVVLVLFKLWLAPPNEVVRGLLAPGVLGYWTDPVRVTFVAREMAYGLYSWGGWPGPLPAVVTLSMVALLASRQGAWPRLVCQMWPTMVWWAFARNPRTMPSR